MMRRYATILAAGVVGGFVGLLGGFAFFSIIDPNPRVATQDGMGEAIFSVFVLCPAFAAASSLLVARLTKK
jgi:hypothetical protein